MGIPLGTGLGESVADVTSFPSVQLRNRCSRLLRDGLPPQLFLEIMPLCQELVKVAPASLQADFYCRSDSAMKDLQRLHEAEVLYHEGLRASGQEGLCVSTVSRTADVP
jgi:hypothetical protein